MKLMNQTTEHTIPLSEVKTGSVVKEGGVFYLVGRIAKSAVSNAAAKTGEESYFTSEEKFETLTNLSTGEVKFVHYHFDVVLVTNATFGV